MERQKATQLTGSIILLIIVHLFIIVSLLINNQAILHQFFPISTLCFLILLFAFHKQWSLRNALTMMAIVLAGFLIELIAVNTGNIFGVFQYGASMGVKINGIPLITGIQWLLLVYITHLTVIKIGITRPWIELTGAGLMTAMDYLIEPVAAKFNLWQWENDYIPMQNFVAWFYISFFMHFYINRVKPVSNNKIAIPTFIILIIFYVILNII
ncbi:MAG: carotenoid biosynthesis protein [Chitinophagales bacterium]|jgi:putative membrane protein|nr:carotenoid biosynthesis protein [Chitinophagales bacterium]